MFNIKEMQIEIITVELSSIKKHALVQCRCGWGNGVSRTSDRTKIRTRFLGGTLAIPIHEVSTIQSFPGPFSVYL